MDYGDAFGGYFGGDEDYGELYYRLLKALDPPGVYDDSDDTVHNKLKRVDAEALGSYGQMYIDAFVRESFPHTAELSLPDWERLFKVVPPPGATIAERQDIVASRWRAALSSSPKNLRKIVADTLNPSTMFHDRFDDEGVCAQFIARGLGDATEAASEITLAVSASEHACWTIEEKGACLRTIKLNDRSDDFTIKALITARAANTDGTGIVLFQSWTSAIKLGLFEDSGSTLKVELIQDNKFFRTYSKTPPPFPFWLIVSRALGAYRFDYGTSLDDLTKLGEFAAEGIVVRPREVGLFTQNASPSYLAASGSFDDLIIGQGKRENNVELIETKASSVPSSPEHVYFSFIHREPGDPGSYNIKEAQRAMNRAKQAHTLILVGESDCFLCDDPFSLCDRDILGC